MPRWLSINLNCGADMGKHLVDGYVPKIGGRSGAYSQKTALGGLGLHPVLNQYMHSLQVTMLHLYAIPTIGLVVWPSSRPVLSTADFCQLRRVWPTAQGVVNCPGGRLAHGFANRRASTSTWELAVLYQRTGDYHTDE